MTPEECAQVLEQHPDYKILRRLPLRDEFNVHDGRRNLARAIVLDTETTGLSLEADQVIELGMLVFEFDPRTGQVYRVVQSFNQLEDPGRPIPPESTQVHHITDQMVRGMRIDNDQVLRLLQGVSVVIAHNASFDRPFVEKRWPAFQNLMWGCSLKDIDWKNEGFGSARLEYLLYTQGIFYEGHRADTDCRALLEILSRALPNSQQSALLCLLENLNRTQTRIYALNTAFETKDKLKQRGYRWDGEMRCWHNTLNGQYTLQDETAWLKKFIYADKKGIVEVETLDAKVRFSQRPGPREKIFL